MDAEIDEESLKNETELVQARDKCINARARKTLQEATIYCAKLADRASKITSDLLQETDDLDASEICFVAVGSVGRDEALQASDLDLIPVCSCEDALKRYVPHDKRFREMLSERLEVKVSAGSDLTKAISLAALVDPETIGGVKDDSSALTKRLLVLTESKTAGGALKLRDIRKALLSAYADNERTRGRHVLSLCNDIARYYRTLCIEYKAKIDVDDKDWCTRNLKLRHSRKFWYYSSMFSIVALADTHPDGQQAYTSGLLRAFELPPSLRLINSVSDQHRRLAGQILDRFAWFLEFMSDKERRKTLSQIHHDNRYKIDLHNPFPMMKLNSDVLHTHMSKLIEEQDGHIRQRIIDWFLL